MTKSLKTWNNGKNYLFKNQNNNSNNNKGKSKRKKGKACLKFISIKYNILKSHSLNFYLSRKV